MMLTILSAVQFERHRIGERIRDAKRHTVGAPNRAAFPLDRM
jgi:hypothetical protein